MIYLTMHADELPMAEVKAATFHPFADVWWVIADHAGRLALATFTDGVCTKVELYSDYDAAHRRFMGLATAAAKEGSGGT
jgi:hypothetical protein